MATNALANQVVAGYLNMHMIDLQNKSRIILWDESAASIFVDQMNGFGVYIMMANNVLANQMAATWINMHKLTLKTIPFEILSYM